MLTPPPNNFPPEQYRLIEWLINRVVEQGEGQSAIEMNSKYVISQVDGALKRAEQITSDLADTKVVTDSLADSVPEVQAGLEGIILNENRAGRAPAQVIGVTLDSNTAYWVGLDTPKAEVKLSWTPVTTEAWLDEEPPPEDYDASIVVAGYEVWSRLNTDTYRRDTQVLTPEATIDTWEPGVERIVQIRAISKDGVPGLWSDELVVTPAYPGTLIPKAPTGLSFTQTAAFTEIGPRATVTLSWNAVTQNTDNQPIDIKEYEIWVDDYQAMRTTDTGAIIVIPSQVTQKVQVAAVSDAGVRSALSSAVNVTGQVPDVVPRVPTDPVLTTSHGTVRATWDGDYTTGGDVLGGHVVHVEARVGTSGNFIQQGAPLSKAGEQSANIGKVGQTVQVRFRAYDRLGRLTGTSNVVSITVAGLEFTDFDSASQDYIGSIEGTALEAMAEAKKASLGRNLIFDSKFEGGLDYWLQQYGGRVNDLGPGLGPVFIVGMDYDTGTPLAERSTIQPFVSEDSLHLYPQPGETYELKFATMSTGDYSFQVQVSHDNVTLFEESYTGLHIPTVRVTIPEDSRTAALLVSFVFPMTDGSSQIGVLRYAELRNITADAKASEALGQTAILGKTVDGKNSRFVSMLPPVRGVYRATGSGVEVFENLAPVIQGSGTWAEVRRNIITNPFGYSSNPSSVPEGWAMQWFGGGTGTGVYRQITDDPNYPNVVEKEWTGDAQNNWEVFGGPHMVPVTPGDTIHASIDMAFMAAPAGLVPANSGGGLRFRIRFYDASQAIMSPHHYGDIRSWDDMVLGRYDRYEHTVTVPANAAYMNLSLYFYGGGSLYPPLPVTGTRIRMSMAFAEVDTHGEAFAPGRSPDPDMRTRWLGTPNASESVMEIEAVAGLSGVEGIPGVSEWNGKPAVRIIPTTESSNSYVEPVPHPVPSGPATLMGTLHLVEPLSGTLSANALRLQRVVPFENTTQSPNEAGSYPHRLVSADGGTRMLLRHGGSRGSGDVWWTDIGLYAGSLPDDIRHYAPGDEYQQLGWKPGENEGDPDRLVIEHIYVWNGDNWVSHDIWAQNIFAAGSVTARLLNADEIYADEGHVTKLSGGLLQFDTITGLGNNLNIRGNDSITFMIGDDESDGIIGEHSDRITNAEIALNGNPDVPGDSGVVAVANEARIAAQDAGAELTELLKEDGRIDTVEKEIAELGTVVVIETDGVHVKSRTGQYETVVTPLGVEIRQGDVATALFEGTALSVAQIYADDFPRFAGHKVTNPSTTTPKTGGETIITPW